MQIPLKIVNLAIISLIYGSFAHSQTYRGNPNIDDLVAAIATAALNGALPLHRMGLSRSLGNPNRKGDVLRIPILLIRPNDFNRKKGNNWNNKNGRPRNGRDFTKKDYSPKQKYPSHGLKVIPAPKEFEYEKSELKKNFDKKPINAVQINNRYNDRNNDRNRDFDDDRDRYEEQNNGNAVNRVNGRQNRISGYQSQNEEGYDRQNDRSPVRQSENWRELPEREPVTEDIDYVDDKSGDQLPALKPVLKVPAVVRHVYGAPPPLENSGKPTIPPRYLKAVADIPSPSDSSPEKYDSTREMYNGQNNGQYNGQNNGQYNGQNNGQYNGQYVGQYREPMSKIPSLSELMPPPEEQGVSYRTEPVIVHKSINMGDVYRKSNNEEPDEELPPPVDESDGPLAGYAKDQYDKQLIGTLTKLMANSKNRASPLNIGGLGGSEAVQSIKPATKTTKNYFTSAPSGESSQTRGDSYLSRFPSIFSSSSQTSQNPVSKSSVPYTSQSQSNSQSKIPEYLLSPFSSDTSNSAQPVKTVSDYLTPINRGEQQPLQPGQVPLLPEVNRKPVSLDLGFDSGTRPLSAYSVFNAAEE